MGINARYRVGQEVELTTDLTRYHPKWIKGTRGKIVPDNDIWARSTDRFVSVDYGPEIGIRDTLVSNLKIERND